MSVFDYFKDKTLNEKGDIVTKIENPQPLLEEPDEWVWIEGYKGTDSEMKCKNDFQFELNKEYTVEGEIRLCNNGFHFCKELEDVFSYYTLNSKSRYFKVKALVNLTQIEKQKELLRKQYQERYPYTHVCYPTKDDKLVAKTIILTEEVCFKELLPHIQKRFYYIETEDDWNLVNKLGYDKYKRHYFINKMDGLGFGETFLNVLYDEHLNDNHLDSAIKFAQALKEENVSKDMAVYLLLKHCK